MPVRPEEHSNMGCEYQLVHLKGETLLETGKLQIKNCFCALIWTRCLKYVLEPFSSGSYMPNYK